MDFTIKTYHRLLNCLENQSYVFQTFSEFIESPSEKALILRHDVDRLPENSLVFARIQAKRAIKGTYYFRAVPGSWNERIIREISSMGHEIGYHYEDLNQYAACGMRYAEKDLAIGAFEEFKNNLARLREIVTVKTICMHGSPISRWDSRLLWKYFNYRNLGIIAEPYFDIDFNEMLYLTDTGRRWDGEAFSVRDKAQGSGQWAKSKEHRAESENPYKDWKVKPVKYRIESQIQSDNPQLPATSNQQPATRILVPESLNLEPRTSNLEPRTSSKFHSTFDIIKAAETGKLSPKIMLTFHPQRWTDKSLPWLRELVWQNLKNPAKYFLIKFNNGITK